LGTGPLEDTTEVCSTVLLVTPSPAPTSSLVSPSATSRTTSSSRGVSAGGGASCRRSKMLPILLIGSLLTLFLWAGGLLLFENWVRRMPTRSPFPPGSTATMTVAGSSVSGITSRIACLAATFAIVERRRPY
jgi:hypothetical protein